MNKHTPGPWNREEASHDLWWEEESILSPKGQIIAATRNRCPEHAANARLIAAAPDLYDICRNFIEKVESGNYPGWRDPYAQMKQVLDGIEDS